MAALTKPFLVALFILSLVDEGFCACSLDNINVGTVRSEREIEGKPVWNVTVMNNCACTQSHIKLACKGFSSVEPVDPSILAKQGDECLLINGNALAGFAAVNYSYAWDLPFVLFPASSVVGPCACSLDSINVGTVRSGREIRGKPEWNVTVINICACPQSHIKFSCKGFSTVEPVDPSILAKQGDECLLVRGNPLVPFATVNFSYAWDPPFVLFPVSSVAGDC